VVWGFYVTKDCALSEEGHEDRSMIVIVERSRYSGTRDTTLPSLLSSLIWNFYLLVEPFVC
jgi:hypothetical protein